MGGVKAANLVLYYGINKSLISRNHINNNFRIFQSGPLFLCSGFKFVQGKASIIVFFRNFNGVRGQLRYRINCQVDPGAQG